MEKNRRATSIVWCPKSQQSAKALRSLIDAMDDMGDALRFPPGASVGHIRKAARRVSVELRKLFLDGAPLIHRVLQRTRFDPLRDKNRLTGDTYENSFTMKVAPSTKYGPLLGLTATRTWSIAVRPLHGLRFDSQAKQWIVEPLFDVQAQPLSLDTWLHQTLFRIDQHDYSLSDTLKFIANKEAVHVDIDKNRQAKDMERVHFGHTTYPHLVAVLVASYVLERYQESRIENAELWNNFFVMRSHAIPNYKIMRRAEFGAPDINPVGLGGEFHETGIQMPQAGRVWDATETKEHATVTP